MSKKGVVVCAGCGRVGQLPAGSDDVEQQAPERPRLCQDCTAKLACRLLGVPDLGTYVVRETASMTDEDRGAWVKETLGLSSLGDES